MSLTHRLRGRLVQENKEVYEGEVTELTPEETESTVCAGTYHLHKALRCDRGRRVRSVHSRAAFFERVSSMRSPAGTLPLRELQTGGYGKVITHVVIGLKTEKGTKQLKLDPTIYDTLQKEKARPRRCVSRARWGGARTPQSAPPRCT